MDLMVRGAATKPHSPYPNPDRSLSPTHIYVPINSLLTNCSSTRILYVTPTSSTQCNLARVDTMVLFLYIPPLYSTQTHIETETRFREQRIYIRYTYVYICTTGHICAAVRPIATRAQSVQANKHGELATRPRFTVRILISLSKISSYICMYMSPS